MKKSHDEEAGGGRSAQRARLEPEDRELMAALLRSAWLDVPPIGVETRVMRGLARRSAAGRSRWPTRVLARRRALAATVLGVAAGVVLWAGRGPRIADPSVVAEPPPHLSTTVPRACAHPLRAAGGEPMIDDFEDGDGAIRPLEGRRATWIQVRDSEPAGVSHPLLPALRPEPTEGNRFALHARGDELRDWGASLEIAFDPSCYDASIYAGIAFSARGPGRLYLAVREVRVVSADFGGTCTQDCYNAHTRKIDLEPAWRRFEVRWSDLRQRGYQTPPLDPRSLHSVTFQVHAEDTPYDLWIDDVTFLPR